MFLRRILTLTLLGDGVGMGVGIVIVRVVRVACMCVCMNNCAAVMTIFLSRSISFEGFECIAGLWGAIEDRGSMDLKFWLNWLKERVVKHGEHMERKRSGVRKSRTTGEEFICALLAVWVLRQEECLTPPLPLRSPYQCIPLERKEERRKWSWRHMLWQIWKGNRSVPRLTRSSMSCSRLLACRFDGSFSLSNAVCS